MSSHSAASHGRVMSITSASPGGCVCRPRQTPPVSTVPEANISKEVADPQILLAVSSTTEETIQ